MSDNESPAEEGESSTNTNATMKKMSDMVTVMNQQIQILIANQQLLEAKSQDDELKLESMERRISLAKIPPVQRRLTMDGGKAQVPSGEFMEPTLRVHQEIPQDQKMKKVTAKSYLHSKEVIRVHSSQFQVSKSLIDAMTDEALRVLAQHVQMRQPPGWELITTETIYTLSDASITALMAHYCRPQNATDFLLLLMDSVDSLRPASKDWKVGVAGWDTQMHGPVSKILNQIKDVYEFLMIDIPVKEAQRLPVMGYGTGSDPGLIRHLLKILDKAKQHEFSKIFIAKIGEVALKQCKTFQEFYILVVRANADIAQQARILADAEADLLPKPQPSDLLDTIHDRNMQNKFIAGKALVGPARGQDYQARHSSFNLLDQTPARALQQAIDSPCDTDPPDGRGSVHPDEAEDREDHLCTIGAFGRNPGTPMTGGTRLPRPGTGFPAKPKERTLPCFDFFKTRSCEAGAACAFSHDPKAMQERSQHLLKELLKSPFCGAQGLQIALHEQRSPPPTAPRVHIIVKEEGGQGIAQDSSSSESHDDA